MINRCTTKWIKCSSVGAWEKHMTLCIWAERSQSEKEKREWGEWDRRNHVGLGLSSPLRNGYNSTHIQEFAWGLSEVPQEQSRFRALHVVTSPINKDSYRDSYSMLTEHLDIHSTILTKNLMRKELLLSTPPIYDEETEAQGNWQLAKSHRACKRWDHDLSPGGVVQGASLNNVAMPLNDRLALGVCSFDVIAL